MISRGETSNVDPDVVAGFGDEWTRFDQTRLEASEARQMFDAYFDIFPWDRLPRDPVGFDLGCGSGRWARQVAPRVQTLHCIDASSDAIAVARRALVDQTNCVFHVASVDCIPLPDRSADFGYSLGVLHHVPNTRMALRQCVAKLRRGAPFLVYLYYRFDNRPAWYSALWRISEGARRVVSRMPNVVRYVSTQVIAATVYWPLARFARLLEWMGIDVQHMPLSDYRRHSFYVMRTDALDRFGTPLEQRFTRTEIEQMMVEAGLADIRFSTRPPFWCAVGFRSD
jgi:SAM-dependent methyltransferase